MRTIYNIFIYFFVFACKIASLFVPKVKTMIAGQKETIAKLDKLDKTKKTAWFHCASLGEFEQARSLIEEFKQNKPDYNILVSFFSPSGYEIRKNYALADCVVYLPFDTKQNAKKFIKHANPDIVFFVKYEFWYNYIIELKNIPLYQVSLILRKNHYLRKSYSFWFRKQLRNFDHFFVQNAETQEILNKIGYKNTTICGDTRFDRVYKMSQEEKAFPIVEEFCKGEEKIFVIGSSWPEDEKLVAEATKDIPNLKIIIAPHLTDPSHIESILSLFQNSITYSQANETKIQNKQVLIIDCIGILSYLYRFADIVHIGGGFGEGIHNILEATVFAKPISFGPNHKKFQEAMDLLRLKGAKDVSNANELKEHITSLLNDKAKYESVSKTNAEYTKANIGATKKILSYLSIFLIAIVLLVGCSPSKHISKQGYLLSKNKVNVGETYGLSKGDLSNYIKQDPNKKFLQMKMGMYIYSLSSPGEDSTCNWVERNVFRSIGDKPVEFSQYLAEQSKENMLTYLKTKGCFSAKVEDSLSLVRRWYAPFSYYKKRRVENYNVYIPSRAKIDTFYIATDDENLLPVVSSLIKKDVIKSGDWYDENILADIRSSVATGMQNKGYYAFNASYVVFEIDTLDGGVEHTKIKMRVKNTEDNQKHKPYKVSKIYLQPNYIPITSADYLPPLDTVLFYHKQTKQSAVMPLYFINNMPEPLIKEKTLMRCILMQSNNLYSPLASKNTYSSLFLLRNFKYIDMSYEHIGDMSKDTLDLACYIRLTMNKPVSLSSSFELNYSASNNNSLNYGNSSNFGAGGSLSFINKNLFHGAEIFTANLKLSAEINSNIFTGKSSAKGWEVFNAFESGIDFGLELPRFLAPFSTRFYSMKFHPHTSIKVGYDLQRRSNYNRSIFNMNYGYSWNTSDKKHFYFTPIEVNYVNMDITDSKYQELINRMDRRIQYQMSDHLVMDMRLTYIYSGQSIDRKRDFNYFSANIETAGNVLDAYSLAFNDDKDENGNYTIFNIPFSQYVRGDFSFVRYNYVSQHSSIVFKVYGGVGFAYGNAISLPYEKSFYGGGANNIRAWQLRELGPGHSKPSGAMKYDRAGDIAFGLNLEYRFPLISVLEGAAFIDAGNIWTLRDVSGLEGGKISTDFYKEIATGAGLGLRLNISVMIIRFDFALKVWDPSKELSDRFVLDDAKFKDISVQFGIGYPF